MPGEVLLPKTVLFEMAPNHIGRHCNKEEHQDMCNIKSKSLKQWRYK